MIKKIHKKWLLSAGFAATMLTVNAQTALNFDGVDDFIQGTSTPISGTGNRTVETWIRTTKNSIGNQSIICDWGAHWTGSRFTFNILNNNTLRLEVHGNGINGTTPVNDGQWHHVAVVYNHSAENRVKLYLDGNLENEGNLTVNMYTESDSKLRLGKGTQADNFFQGDMDEFRIWNVALSQAELQDRMYREFCGDEANLVVYYPFNEGTPEADNAGVVTVNDLSAIGGNDNGTLINFSLTGAESNWVIGRPLVFQEENMLFVDQVDATYQWIDCFNDNTAIEGATGQTFQPVASGSYSVEITVDGCVTNSGCVEINLDALGIEENLINNMKIYPNPTSGDLNVALNGVYQTVEAQLVSITGKVVGQYQFSNTNGFLLNLNNVNSGVYFLNLKAGQLEGVTMKVVKM